MCKVTNLLLLAEPSGHDGGCPGDQPREERTADSSAPVKRLCDVTKPRSPKQLFATKFEIPTIHRMRNRTTIQAIGPIFERPFRSMKRRSHTMWNAEISNNDLYDMIMDRFDDVDDRIDRLAQKVERIDERLARIELSKAQSYAKKFTISVEVANPDQPGEYKPFGHGLLVETTETDELGHSVTVSSVLTSGHVGVQIHATGILDTRLVFIGAAPKKKVTCKREDSLLLTKEYIDANGTDLCLLRIESWTDFGDAKGTFATETVEWEFADEVRGLELFGQSSVRIRGCATPLSPLTQGRYIIIAIGVPGSSGTAVFLERNDEVRLVALVKGIVGLDHSDASDPSVPIHEARPYVYADGKGGAEALTFYELKAGTIDELVDYIQWRNNGSDLTRKSSTATGETKISQPDELRRQARHMETSSGGASKIFLKASIKMTVDAVNCVSWIDAWTQKKIDAEKVDAYETQVGAQDRAARRAERYRSKLSRRRRCSV